jgi:hypothetical protein
MRDEDRVRSSHWHAKIRATGMQVPHDPANNLIGYQWAPGASKPSEPTPLPVPPKPTVPDVWAPIAKKRGHHGRDSFEAAMARQDHLEKLTRARALGSDYKSDFFDAYHMWTGGKTDHMGVPHWEAFFASEAYQTSVWQRGGDSKLDRVLSDKGDG